MFLVSQGGRKVWVAALVDEDVWTYVGNTGKFHRNEGVREDYFANNEASYADIGIAEAKRLIAEDVGWSMSGSTPMCSTTGGRTPTVWIPRWCLRRWWRILGEVG